MTTEGVSGRDLGEPLRNPPRRSDRTAPTVTLPLHGLAYQELARESERHGISPSELASFAILYYLADVDSGRIARRIAGVPGQRQSRYDDAR
jgi:hypothetical protein